MADLTGKLNVLYLYIVFITPTTKYVEGRHAGPDPASSIFLNSRRRGNDKHCCQGNKASATDVHVFPTHHPPFTIHYRPVTSFKRFKIKLSKDGSDGFISISIRKMQRVFKNSGYASRRMASFSVVIQ